MINHIFKIIKNKLIVIPLFFLSIIFYVLFLIVIFNLTTYIFINPNEKPVNMIDVINNDYVIKEIDNKIYDLLMLVRSKMISKRFIFDPKKRITDIVIPINKIDTKNSFFPDLLDEMKNNSNIIYFKDLLKSKNLINDPYLIDTAKNNDNLIIEYVVKKDHLGYDNLIFKELDIYEISKHDLNSMLNISGTVKDAYTVNDIKSPFIFVSVEKDRIGFRKDLDNNEGVLREYPLVAKYKEKQTFQFIDLNDNDYADIILLDSFNIGYDKISREYYLKSFNPIIFEQDDKDLNKRKVFVKNDIDLIKSRIEIYETNFELELDILKGKLKKVNKKVSNRIIKYILKSNMPLNMQDQIINAFNDKENLKNIDELLKNLIINFSKMEQDERKWREYKLFFKKMYDECIKINKDQDFVDIGEGNKYVSLYDYLFEQKKVNFNKIELIKEHFLLSIPLLIIAKYYNVDIRNIEIVFGKHIILNLSEAYVEQNKYSGNMKQRNNSIKIPIDKTGKLLINYNEIKMLENIDQINNKIIIGHYSDNLLTDYSTSLNDMNEIEILNNILNTILTNNFIKQLPGIINILLLLCISLMSVIVSYNYSSRSLLYIFIFFILYLLITILLFMAGNIKVEIIKIFMITLISWLTVMIFINLQKSRID